MVNLKWKKRKKPFMSITHPKMWTTNTFKLDKDSFEKIIIMKNKETKDFAKNFDITRGFVKSTYLEYKKDKVKTFYFELGYGLLEFIEKIKRGSSPAVIMEYRKKILGPLSHESNEEFNKKAKKFAQMLVNNIK